MTLPFRLADFGYCSYLLLDFGNTWGFWRFSAPFLQLLPGPFDKPRLLRDRPWLFPLGN